MTRSLIATWRRLWPSLGRRTAARTGEIIGAKWTEIDLSAKLWTIPAERMKAGKEHRVPLSDRAIAILKALPRDGEYVFPGARKNKPLSNMAMLELVRGMRRGATVHGFRSSFRDWAAEMTAHPHEMCEIALAHAVGNKVEAAYRRGDMMEKRRRLMADWAAYCAQTPAKMRDNIVSIGRRGRP
jgi:integrase